VGESQERLGAVPFSDVGLYRALAGFAQDAGVSLDHPSLIEDFSASLGIQLASAAANPIVLYGLGAEMMFDWTVNALGRSILIQPLDSDLAGTLHGEAVGAPDYLIVTDEGTRLVVEVKNCASKANPPKRSDKREYLEGLVRYANALGAEAKVAVFWVEYGLWTLVDVSHLLMTSRAKRVVMTMTGALSQSEMSTLGDRLVYLEEYPFRFRLDYAIQDRRSQGDGRETLGLVVSDVAMTLGSRRVTDPEDSRILWFLAMYAMRIDGGEELELDSDKSAHMEFIAGHDSETAESDSFGLGPLSSALARCFQLACRGDNGEMRRLSVAPVGEGHPVRRLLDGRGGNEIGLTLIALQPQRMADAEGADGAGG